MKKFKRIFYPIYLVFMLGFIYLSLDGIINMESSLVWFNEKFAPENQPYWIMTFFFIHGILMLIEMIVENIHIHQVKQGIDDLEDEIVRLKVKLFDQDDEDDQDDEGDDGNDEDDDND